MSEKQVRVLTHTTEPKGWFVVNPCFDMRTIEPSVTLHRVPVLAWLVESLEVEFNGSFHFENEITPIACHPIVTSEVLQSPDGAFYTESINLDSEADVIEFFLDQSRRDHAKLMQWAE
jgi:hypothetical protein